MNLEKFESIFTDALKCTTGSFMLVNNGIVQPPKTGNTWCFVN
jgi:hypothetical protein